jgi:CHAT domain-containing protein/Tfp pilus assembly protein PilF
VAAGARSCPGANADFSLAKKGVVVEKVAAHTQAFNSKIQPGDILLTWKRGQFSGEIDSPFDLMHIRLEQASRGQVTVRGIRRNKECVWFFGSDIWGISSRPNLTGDILAGYLQAEDLLRNRNTSQAAEQFLVMARSTQDISPPIASWFFSRAAQVFFDEANWNLSNDAYVEALRLASSATPSVRAELLRQWGVGFEYRDDLVNAERRYQAALMEWRGTGRDNMAVANTVLSLAIVQMKGGDLAKAEISLDEVLHAAQEDAPNSLQMALALANFGVLFEDEGDLARAERFYLLALKLEEKHFPGSIHLAHTFTSLGTLAQQEGNLQRAELLERRALSITQRFGESLQVAAILTHLSECVLERGKVEEAERYQKRALLIQQKLAPETISVVSMLANLGKIARKRGALSEAETYYGQAWDLAKRINAPDREIASFLIGRAEVLLDARELPKAEDMYRKSLALLEKSAPQSTDYGNTLAALASILRQEEQFKEATQLYDQALALLEEKSPYLSDITEQRSRYRARLANYYREYIELLRMQGQLEGAFEVVEGFRARTLFERLAQEHAELQSGTDPGLRKRAQWVKAELDAKTTYRLRLTTENHTDQQLSQVEAEISELLLRYQEIQEQMRASDPAHATLATAQNLKISEIQSLLDADTVLLEYVLGEDCSYAWVLTDASVSAIKLPNRNTIETAAHRVYQLMAKRGTNSVTTTTTMVVDRQNDAVRLSRMVIGPLLPLLRHKRLVIVADGALQYIPFSALPDPDAGYTVPLLVQHEISNLPSASVLAELRQRRTGRKQPSYLAAIIADPVFDPRDERLRGASTRVPPKSWNSDLKRSAIDLGYRDGTRYLNRLLYTRNEAKAILAAMPNEKVMLALDFDASRKTVLSPALANYRIVHFATHGILDNRHPELSGLVMSLVNRKGQPEDGFLKLQDIYNMKLPVDLVVLSGCETGIGEQIQGEGLISLTRAFMFAGATRVVASLWSVSDEATAALMGDFYRKMETDGLTPPAALRAAQIQMWKKKRWTSPYYWAAFQIQGEWR